MPLRSLAVGRVTAEYFQSPHPTADLDPAAALIRAIDGAKDLLLFGVYSLTHPDITAALLRAHARGVDICGVVDATQMNGSTNTAKSLVAAGIKVHSWGAPFRLMHDKVLVVDTKVCALGSYNWTTQAQKSNVEVLLVTHGRVGNRLAQALSQQVLTTFNEGKPILI